ncbi:MAG: dephospho-CoA kinase [Oscillospiraceae bacterium]|nr:dephospho-CoA kinase [Oscillospiraceae bacterium]
MIIGITGGTGCGKTTLLKAIEARGGLVLDCDAIYHELLRSDKEMLAAIDVRFPGVIEDGALNRKKLGAIVFTDEQALLDLNTITHSAVKREVLCQLSDNPKLAAIDAIALFEGNLAELCDVTVAVTAPTEDRVTRLMARDGISESYARSRIAAQHDENWFRQRCDYVLENNGEIDAFATKCVAFLHTIGIIESE